MGLDLNATWHLPELSHNPRSNINVTKNDNWFCIEYRRDDESALLFYLRDDGTEVHCTTKGYIPQTDIISFLLGPVIGCVLRLRGKLCLHAAVLSFKGQALALLGDKGAGKSTTTAALLEAGAELVADDIAVISDNAGQAYVEPGYPALRLNLDALKTHRLNPETLERVLQGQNKRYTPLPLTDLNWQFCQSAVPLKKIYLLEPRSTETTPPIIKNIDSKTAAASIMSQRYVAYMVSKRGLSQEFSSIADLARNIHISKVKFPSSLERLPQNSALLLKDFSESIGQ